MKHTFIQLGLFLLCLPVLAHAGDPFPFKRTLVKTYHVQAGAELSLDSKYGKINLHVWDQPVIKATITITGFGQDEDQARSMAEGASVSGQQTGNRVSLQTRYATSSSGSGGSLWNRLLSSVGNHNGKQYVNVDYEVYLPRSLALLSVANSYGDVWCEDVTARTQLTIKYGKFRLGNMKALSLESGYSQGTVGGAEQIAVNASYSEIKIDKAGQLKIDSKYGKFNLGDIGNLQNNSSYDAFAAEQVEKTVSDSRYTDYKFGSILLEGDLDITYGKVKVDALGNRFRQLQVDGRYANIDLGLPGSLSCRLDLELDHGNVNHSGSWDFRKVEDVNDKGKRTFRATLGDAGEAAAPIRVRGAYTDVSLKHAK
ncbi:DUF4097 family beta strand repeat-containing protein [Compostibacter hankyongensis]|uniref:Adhesin domain-containing protein n=1 Tax=Compostibacter hankyongensis TaxID=1007089 RepID=A0ABP8FQ77_9BACT